MPDTSSSSGPTNPPTTSNPGPTGGPTSGPTSGPSGPNSQGSTSSSRSSGTTSRPTNGGGWIGGGASDANRTSDSPFATTTTTTTTTTDFATTVTEGPARTTIREPANSQEATLGDLLGDTPGVSRLAICKSYSEALLDATEQLVNDLSDSYIPLDPSTALCVAYVGPAAELTWEPQTWPSYMSTGNRTSTNTTSAASAASAASSAGTPSPAPSTTSGSQSGAWGPKHTEVLTDVYAAGLASVSACCAPDGKLRWPPLANSPCALPNNSKTLDAFAGCVAAMGAYAVCGENRTGQDGAGAWSWKSESGSGSGGGAPRRGVAAGLLLALVGAVAAVL